MIFDGMVLDIYVPMAVEMGICSCKVPSFKACNGAEQVYFRILNNESSGELTYVLGDLDAGEAVVVDPHARDLSVLLALLAERELRLRWVLRTHHHDALHPNEFRQLELLGAPLIQGDLLPALGLCDGAVLPFGFEQVKVIRTPGHTPDCLSFIWRDRVFCGGLLAVAACPHQARALSPEDMWDSVTQWVFSLPDETLLFAGHESQARAVSTVLEQRRWHPLFSGLTRDEFLARVAALPDTKLDPTLT
jgi:glyoxylase-like metal-dependent hydrolase (beta-lactamase superfamily II)